MDEILFKNISIILTIVSIILGMLLLSEGIFKNRVYKSFEWKLTILFTILYSVYFAFRPVLKYSDTSVYIYKYINNMNSLDEVLNAPKDFFFFLYSYFTKLLVDNENAYLFFIAITYIAPLLLVIKKINIKHPFIIFALFTLSFSFENLGGNIIRQGIGINIFLLGLIFYNDNKLKAYLLFLLSMLFHISVLIPIGIFFLATKLKNKYFYLAIYLICSVISILNINVISFIESIPYVSELFADRNQNYSDVVGNYKVGFRLDFFLFNSLFLLMFWVTSTKFKFSTTIEKEQYERYLFIYMSLSAFFFLMFTQSFSDRYGVLSWQMIPILFLPYVKYFKSKIWILNIGALFLIYSIISLIFKLK
ncbi:EpsG family protein [Chishuiella sp.]|uniref:EpsG family protein n=1 Tax=Chishuiella sp. TaxID=1969467 RepID=UPI0028AC524B|nr:EpsG family protein [Chishuiella sp.]